MGTLFLDSSVPLHALGGDHPARAPARALLERAMQGGVRLHMSAESVQEFLFHRMRRTHRFAAIDQTHLLRSLAVTHAMDDEVIERALRLVSSTEIRGRDAFIAATALIAGFDTVVTTDTRFVAVPGLRPLSPAEALAQLGP